MLDNPAVGAMSAKELIILDLAKAHLQFLIKLLLLYWIVMLIRIS